MSHLLKLLTKLNASMLPIFMGLIMTFGLLAPSVLAQTNRLTPSQEILCRGDCPALSNPESALGNATENELAAFIVNIARFITFIGVALAVLLLVYGGILYVTDSGDGKKAEAGKTIILNSVIGLVIIIAAYTIVAVVVGFLNGDILGSLLGTGGTSGPNNNTTPR